MKNNKKNELDVDFIGGQVPLTKEEEKAISTYINSEKAKSAAVVAARKKAILKHEKVAV